jgi:translation elongation factor EF-Tu-like GTPase
MGILDKIFGKDEEFISDDERELREYEENEYSGDTRVESSTYAEFIAEDDFPTGTDSVVVVGTVTAGTFRTGDKVVIESSLTGKLIFAKIAGIEKFRKTCTSISEGEHAGILFSGVTSKQIKRNDIIKKMIEGSEGEDK